MRRLGPVLLLTALATCSCKDQATQPSNANAVPLDRTAFNREAAALAYPLFWVADANGNQQLDPNEVAVLWGIDATVRKDWVNGDFTPKFKEALAQISAAAAPAAPASAGENEASKRRRLLLDELGQGRPTLVFTDFANATPEDRAVVEHVLEAAKLIEKIYAKQNGVNEMAKQIGADDPAARMVFYRNQSPWCAAPKTDSDPLCSAVSPTPARVSGLYPADLQANGDFCDALEAHPKQKELLAPFVTVARDDKGELTAVPYSQAYAAEMQGISKQLNAAASAIQSPGEAPFKAYLSAAAQAFLDNNWQPADEAWSKMSVNNSKWYLRIGPDETYFEPCNRKAGFHVSFALINQDSVRWQKRLDPIKNDMEQVLAQLAGPPYKAREVSFHLPDFIDMVLNAGDSRSPVGATIGQSLPNWGPVANEGRGRTVAMTNLYTDDDSKVTFREQASALFCAPTMAYASDVKDASLIGTLLHEAAHNLGPAHEYEVDGKTDDVAFGGPLASMLEELKAQTSALYFTDWLVEKKVIDETLARQAHFRDIAWAFGHIARGMYTSDNKPKAYSQLAAIQVGYLLAKGAITWDATTAAANGEDTGCFTLHVEALAPAVEQMITEVAGIKARGDRPAAEALKATHVDGKDTWSELRDVIAERWLRAPKASFVYAVRL